VDIVRNQAKNAYGNYRKAANENYYADGLCIIIASFY